MTTQPTTPAPRPCTWPACLTTAQHAELAAQVTAEEKGQPRPPMPDQRPICGCTEAPTPATRTITVTAPTTPTPGRSHAVGDGTFLHGGPREGCTLPGCRPGDTTPAPVDPALMQRVVEAIRTALKTRTAPALTDYAGRPISGTEIGLTEHDLAAIVLAELAPELTRARQTVNAENALRDEKRHYDSAWREIVRLRAQLVRIQQMTDAWERELPETIRTATVVDALRIAIALTGPAEENQP